MRKTRESTGVQMRIEPAWLGGEKELYQSVRIAVCRGGRQMSSGSKVGVLAGIMAASWTSIIPFGAGYSPWPRYHLQMGCNYRALCAIPLLTHDVDIDLLARQKCRSNDGQIFAALLGKRFGDLGAAPENSSRQTERLISFSVLKGVYLTG